MAGERLVLSASEHLEVVSSDASTLVVHATYGPDGTPPPRHLHPAHDEFFEVLSGRVAVRVDGWSRTLDRGDRLAVPARSVHRIWNPGGVDALVRWEMRPPGRAEQWFRALSDLHGRSPAGRPDPLALAVLLDEYDDVLRLTGAPGPVLRGAVRAAAAVARHRGRGVPAPGRPPSGER